MNRYATGGYAAASVADAELMGTLKTHEGRDVGLLARAPFLLATLAIIVDAETTVVINETTEITITADIPYSNDQVLVHSLVFKADGVNYKLAYNY